MILSSGYTELVLAVYPCFKNSKAVNKSAKVDFNKLFNYKLSPDIIHHVLKLQVTILIGALFAGLDADEIEQLGGGLERARASIRSALREEATHEGA